MSTEGETPIEATSGSICGICETAIADDNIESIYKCQTCDKLTCLTCAKRMIDIMFSEPAINYPFRCAACSELADERLILDLIIKQEQYEKYIACIFPLYWAKDCLQQNEALAQCKN